MSFIRKDCRSEGPIDFVITWVDGNDPVWLESKERYLALTNTDKVDARKRRFRDWGTLVYLFRGIANYAPWVNHVYLVTPNQIPSWLDISSELVTVVNQDDLFEDKSVLPTFNNCAVELLLHRIPGLSEQFVYINDDMFFLRPTTPTDFFKDGLPCITASLSPTIADFTSDGKGVYGIDVMNTRLVAKHFRKNVLLRNSWKKLLDPRNGREVIKTLCCLPFDGVTGFNEMHTAYSYLRSTFSKVWEVERSELDAVATVRFRGEFCVNHHAMRYWQIAEGNISIRRRSFSKMFNTYGLSEANAAFKAIKRGRPKMICINDNISSDDEFETIRSLVVDAFEERFPYKCKFEL